MTDLTLGEPPEPSEPLTRRQQAELALMQYIADPATPPEDADELLAELRRQFRARQQNSS